MYIHLTYLYTVTLTSDACGFPLDFSNTLLDLNNAL